MKQILIWFWTINWGDEEETLEFSVLLSEIQSETVLPSMASVVTSFHNFSSGWHARSSMEQKSKGTSESPVETPGPHVTMGSWSNFQIRQCLRRGIQFPMAAWTDVWTCSVEGCPNADMAGHQQSHLHDPCKREGSQSTTDPLNNEI